MSRVSGPGLVEMVWPRRTLSGERGFDRPAAGELLPLVFEAGGRPADETVAFVRSWGVDLDSAELSRVIRCAWQLYSCTLQSGNAEMILSSIG